MTYRIDFTSAAAKQIRKLPRSARERVLEAVSNLADDPRPHGAKKLVGEQTASARGVRAIGSADRGYRLFG